jgi:hypothetical protein
VVGRAKLYFNFYVFEQQMRRQINVLNWMLANITRD